MEGNWTKLSVTEGNRYGKSTGKPTHENSNVWAKETPEGYLLFINKLDKARTTERAIMVGDTGGGFAELEGSDIAFQVKACRRKAQGAKMLDVGKLPAGIQAELAALIAKAGK